MPEPRRAFAGLNSGVAQSSLVSVWQTSEDGRGAPKSRVELYEQQGEFSGKIVDLLQGHPMRDAKRRASL